MLLAKPADPQIPSSTRERTDCISSLATHVVQDAVSPPSRLVSLPKSERDEDNKVRWDDWISGWPQGKALWTAQGENYKSLWAFLAFGGCICNNGFAKNTYRIL